MAGEAQIPDLTPTHDLKRDYGALGDGRTDDSDAFVKAINEMPANSVLFIPPGRYVLQVTM
jgi:polygalacturonase